MVEGIAPEPSGKFRIVRSEASANGGGVPTGTAEPAPPPRPRDRQAAGTFDGQKDQAWKRARGTAAAGVAGRLRGFATYGASRMLAEALLGLRGVVLAAILGPEVFGVWALFQAHDAIAAPPGSVCCAASNSGERSACRRDGSGDGARAERRDRAGLPAAGVRRPVAGCRDRRRHAARPLAQPALAGIAGGLLFDRLWSYGATYLRATSELWRLALYELINAVLQIVLVVALAYVWGLKSALVEFVLASAAALLCLRGRVPVRLSLSLPRLRSLLPQASRSA